MLALLMASAATLLVVSASRGRVRYLTQDPEDAPRWWESVSLLAAQAVDAVAPGPVADMHPSAELLAMLRKGEAVRLRRYRLGDGGWTIGVGRYYPDGGPMPPESIDMDTAEQWFAEDVEQRGAKWVRAAVSVPLFQHEFDALVHMQYNLSPAAFRRIAAEVNAGRDPEPVALQYVRAGTDLERGLRARRAREIALYRTAVYA